MKKYYNLFASIVLLLTTLLIGPVTGWLHQITGLDFSFFIRQKDNLFILFFAWFTIVLIRIVKVNILKQYDISESDNLESRKLHTQIRIFEKVLVFITILVAIGLILLSFGNIRKIGIGILSSAGLAGIIVGLSAQKVVGALLAGIQIAITQPFRIDDAVVVEGEWGWIEEINLTYVVVRLWDKRRLVLPSSYFLEKPFQNWTRTSADIIGSVFLYTDYDIPMDVLRNELTRILQTTELWDKEVNVIQVTDNNATTMESRILVSAKDSPTAWDLRVLVREKMIDFIQRNYPESLPRTRINLEKDKAVFSTPSS